MALARPGLEKAINDILERRGVDGKRLSYRQAERLTGLSTATISELAKGNARTSDSLRRFAQGLEEDATRLMLLAGFVPEEVFPLRGAAHQETSALSAPLEPETDSKASKQEALSPGSSLDFGRTRLFAAAGTRPDAASARFRPRTVERTPIPLRGFAGTLCGTRFQSIIKGNYVGEGKQATHESDCKGAGRTGSADY